MTVAWPAFGSATLGDTDFVVGITGAGVNKKFSGSQLTKNANNLDDLADALIAFNNISPLTTDGDMLIFDSLNNVRLAIGTSLQIMGISAGLPAWIDNPGLLIASNLSDLDDIPTALGNLGLSSTDDVGFAHITGTVTTASATPGTSRAIIGSITCSNSVMTSGNIVGVRGVANVVGTSGGFVYGTQGKVIATGALTGSAWNVGLFGQLDISSATVNAGQCAPIWGDYGTSSGTLTNQTGLYGIAMTNTTAAVLAGQLYLYGGAQNLMLLNTNSGLSGVTYFKNAGTTAGSWGNATPPTPSKVLKLNIDGTDYYLPLVAQNS